MGMGKKYSSLFDGFPKTKIHFDQESKIEAATVSVAVLTPLRKFLVDKLRWLVGLSFAIISGSIIYETPNASLWDWTLPIPIFVAGVFTGHFGLGELLKAKTVFQVTRDTFEHRNWYGRWNVYDRRQQHRFILRDHKWAQTEARWIDFFKTWVSLKNLPMLARPYCGESYHICFEFGHRPIRLMTIYGKTYADLTLGRFTAIDEAMDGTLAGSGGMRLDPKEDWSQGVGGLQQNF